MVVDLVFWEIGTIEVTGSRVGDAPILPELLDQIPHHQAIASVSADGAFDTRNCREAIAHAMPTPLPSPAAMRKPGPKISRTLRSGTKFFAQSGGSAERSGNDRAAITSAAWSKQKCIAPSCRANASWHEASMVRSPKCKSAQPSSTASFSFEETESSHANSAAFRHREASGPPTYKRCRHDKICGRAIWSVETDPSLTPGCEPSAHTCGEFLDEFGTEGG